MSEAERKRRQNYKKNRKRWIVAQAVIIALVAVFSIFSFLLYDKMNETYYIEYTEISNSDYLVQYDSNTFFGDEWIPSGKSYVSSLVKAIKASFNYKMDMDTSGVAFDYTYKVVAELVVADKQSGTPIYSPTDLLIPETAGHESDSDGFVISESVMVDFGKYNDLAEQFVTTYGLSNTKSYLTVSLYINVISTCEEFQSNGANNHSVSITLPLREENFSINAMASVPNGESKVLACKDDMGQRLFATLSASGAGLTAILALILLIFIYSTRNEDINYANKVRKLLSAYRSFIQQIDGEFDTNGYQLVPIKTFTELLNIRDTIQSPVLMSENEDETRAQFLIPTNTKLLYLFEIKVDNYDEIYGRPTEPINEAPVNDEPETEPEVLVDVPVCEEIEEISVDNNDGSLESDSSDEGEDDGEIAVFDETGNKILIKCTRSCLANIIQSDNSEAKSYYSELKNHILSYKGVKARMSWKHESFNKGRNQLFKLKVRGKTICLYCALNPEEFEVTKYFHKAVNSKTYEKVPMLIKIRSDRALSRAIRLIDLVMSNFDITKNPAFTETNYISEHPYERTNALIERGLIKILVPDGYVAIDPYHIIKAEEDAKLLAESPEAETEAEIEDDSDEIAVFDETGNKILIKCTRSCLANIIQSDNSEAKAYYSELKNRILSYKGVKARMSWKHESFNKGRNQLFKLKVRGKTICLYCALNPEEFEVTKYFHKAVNSKTYEKVPMLIKIRSDRALSRAIKLIDLVMSNFDVTKNPSFVSTDYVSGHPYERTEALVERGLIKLLDK